jgi:DNA-binding response OmpR family regulator
VYVHVSQLRRKLTAADASLKSLVQTEPGIGYRITSP